MKNDFLDFNFRCMEQVSLTMEEKRKDLLGESWFNQLKAEFNKTYMLKLGKWIAERRLFVQVLPEPQDVFRAFKLCPYEDVKVVFVGQDPYFTPGIADGLAFSCKVSHFVPNSLQRMYEALEESIHFGLFLDNDPDLSRWARQGVLLLNTILTVEANEAGSHEGIGWEIFTTRVLEVLNQHPLPIAFVFIGSKAKKFREKIVDTKHYVIELEHPSYASRQLRKWKHEDVFSRLNAFCKSKRGGILGW